MLLFLGLTETEGGTKKRREKFIFSILIVALLEFLKLVEQLIDFIM